MTRIYTIFMSRLFILIRGVVILIWWKHKLYSDTFCLVFQVHYCEGNAPLNFGLRLDITRRPKAIWWPDFLSWSTFSQINICRPQALMKELAYFVISRCEEMHNGLFVALSQRGPVCVPLLQVGWSQPDVVCVALTLSEGAPGPSRAGSHGLNDKRQRNKSSIKF